MSSRVISRISGFILISMVAFLAGMYSGRLETLPFRVIENIKEDVETVVSESSNLAGTNPSYWTVDKRTTQIGISIQASTNNDTRLIFLQGFFGDGLELRLIRRDGTLVARWPVSFKRLAGDITHVQNVPATDWNVGFHGAVLLPDGSVVFNLSHVGLFKMGRCGDPKWSVNEPVHHSVEQNIDGSFWVASAEPVNSLSEGELKLFNPPYASDALLRVSAEGKVLEKISLADVFVRSNEMGLLTLTGSIDPRTIAGNRPDFDWEIFHLNDVEQLPKDLAEVYPMFTAGDLLVSSRNRNLILVIDGSSKTIKWWHIGPWVRQHDPDWGSDGLISLFDNNRDGTINGQILGGSRIVSIDPTSRQTEIRYGGSADEFFYSERRGKHQLLEDGGILIVEAEAGRIFEIDRARSIVWEYTNTYSETQNARITDARIYDKGYFSVDDWSCPKQ